MTSLGLLIIRVAFGSLLAGHGAQKLFGAFGGQGLDGTAGWLESMGMRPGRVWATLAGVSEFGGGVLTMLGMMNPMGPIMGLGSMLMASVKVHGGKPIWVSSGGAELPVTNMAIQSALIISGPGRLSVDALLGTRLSRWIAIPGVAAVVATVAYAARASEEQPGSTEDIAGSELQGGEGSGAADETTADAGMVSSGVAPAAGVASETTVDPGPINTSAEAPPPDTAWQPETSDTPADIAALRRGEE